MMENCHGEIPLARGARYLTRVCPSCGHRRLEDDFRGGRYCRLCQQARDEEEEKARQGCHGLVSRSIRDTPENEGHLRGAWR